MKKLKIFGMAIGIILVLVTSGCFVSQNSYDKLQTERDELQQEITALQNENGSLTTEVESLTSEIAGLNNKYPPRHFNSYDELREWVDNHCPLRYGDDEIGLDEHQELQEAALADGYIWSVAIIPNRVLYKNALYQEEGQHEWEEGQYYTVLQDTVEYEVRSCVVAGGSFYSVWPDGYIEDWGPNVLTESGLNNLRNPDKSLIWLILPILSLPD